MEALKTAQLGGGLLDPEKRAMTNRFLGDLRNLKEAGLKLSEIEKLVENVKTPIGAGFGKQNLQGRKEFLHSIKSTSQAVNRPNGFSVDELEALAKSQDILRGSFSNNTNAINLHHVNDALESIKLKGFNHSDIEKILDNKILSINSKGEQAARAYIKNVDNTRNALGDRFSPSHQALRTAQEKFNKMILDEKQVKEQVTSAHQTGGRGKFPRFRQSLHQLAKFRQTRIKDSLLSLQQAGYNNEDIMVMLNNDLLVTDSVTKQIVRNYLKATP